MKIVQIAQDSFTLEKHWSDGKTQNLIKTPGLSYAILQDQSSKPIANVDSTLCVGKTLCDFFKKKGINSLFFMTWAHKGKSDTMLPGLLEGYCRAAKAKEKLDQAYVKGDDGFKIDLTPKKDPKGTKKKK